MGVQDIGWAIRGAKMGKKVAREGWDTKGMYIFLAPADKEGAVSVPELIICCGSRRFPWSISQTDALAEDWQIVE